MSKIEGLMGRMHGLRSEVEPEPAAEPAPDPAPDPAPAPAELEPTSDTSATPEPVVPDVGSTEELVFEDAPVDPVDPPAETISTLEDVSRVLNVPVDELYKVSIPVSVDGKRIEVPIGEWKDAYQSSEVLQRKQQEVDARNQELGGYVDRWVANIERAEVAAKVFYDSIVEDEKNIDWAELRREDPNEYVIRKQEFQERKAAMEGKMDAIRENRLEAQKTYQEDIANRQQQYRLKQREALFRALPDWRDEKKAAAERTRICGYLKSKGFNDQEINSEGDHRLIMVAREAMLYKEARDRALKGKKGKSSTTPTLKPTSGGSRQPAAEEQTQAARAKLKKTGKLRDATALYRSTRNRK